MRKDSLEERMRIATEEGLAIKYKATDEDLPSIFWPDVEKEFWKDLEKSLETKI